MVLPSSVPPSPSARAKKRWYHSFISTRYPYVSPRLLLRALRVIVPTAAVAAILFFFFFELHIEITPYRRAWVQREISVVPPLSGCFDERNVHPDYNLTHMLHGPRFTELHAGVPMRLGLDCYDFAGTIQNPFASIRERRTTTFHTYWRTDLAAFGPRQEWMLKSFLATQPPAHSRLIIWSNGELSTNTVIRRYLDTYPTVFETRVVDVNGMARGTALEGSKLLDDLFDARAWVDGDVVRLLALWQEGGAWIDMDVLLTRDFWPLLEHEYITQWDCYDKVYQTFNGAFMHFHKRSPYLCEAFHIMATSDPPRPSSTDWGALLYLKLWRRLIAAGVRPFQVLPFCLTDGHSCRLDNRLPDPFTKDPAGGGWTGGLSRAEGGGLDQRLKKVFAVHLHNQWERRFPEGGWVDRLLLRRYERTLAERAGTT
ncbi:glycosyltransferase family 32 protein [Vararia minispora EC-137]|uniref:Glycosyltransferase family 32 protein n=1 Tax=Vararia minispora EC-137 TaxID=1314806 RepID=A0ACB8Q870_9AGAM|nr:glycosyltransferase family 32 protein [Vararia minispora EC-137]